MSIKQNLLVTLSDKNYLEQAKQLFSSVYWNAGWRGDYMLLAHEVPEADLEWFRKKGILIWQAESLSAKGLGSWQGSYSSSVTSKLRLFSPEFKRWKTVVFVDADCIVRYPLDALTETRHFAAVHDWFPAATIGGQAYKPESMDDSEYETLFRGYDLTSTAFNTGVFAFNSDIIDGQTQARLEEISLKYDQVSVFPEQLWLNLYFYKTWERLPMEYNFFASYLHTMRRLPKDQVDGVVLHFPRCQDKAVLRCWDRNDAFYDEWKANLERAELIDLEHIPQPGRHWPGSRRLFVWRWRLRMALRSDYLRFYRNKLSLRSRVGGVLSALKFSLA
jgi:lipopolysaccharide biosynthesis glycosyltransferase